MDGETRDIPDETADDATWVFGHAALAPSSHNTQPWVVEGRREGGVDVYVDRDRLLPEVDPYGRQTHISLGCFIEGAVLAARRRGRSVEVEVFPEGAYGPEEIENRPVARIEVAEGGAAPTGLERRLFGAMADRQTNKRPFETDRSIPPQAVEQMLRVVGDGGVTVRYIDDDETLESLVEICTDAMAVETAGEARNRELTEWFRFRKRELEQKRDGFGVAQSGTTGVMRWIVETFVLDEEEAVDPGGTFARQAVEMSREQAQTASAFVALVTEENGRVEQLEVGRSYLRLQLMATAYEVATHPLSQAIQEYGDMDPVRERVYEVLDVGDGRTVQMLVRAGYADPVPFAPRRPIEALVRSGDR